jgi:hypothetical protein
MPLMPHQSRQPHALSLDRDAQLDPENQGPVYSSAFLLEREGRLAEAATAWQHIVDYCDERGWDLTAAWPRQELQRIRGLLAGP